MVRPDWVWITPAVAEAAHAEQIAEHGGGGDVLRDRGLFESAMARPQQLAHYGQPDAAALAAAYAYGLARNHPFVDGNKRIAAVVSETFLLLNGHGLTATDAELGRDVHGTGRRHPVGGRAGRLVSPPPRPLTPQRQYPLSYTAIL